MRNKEYQNHIRMIENSIEALDKQAESFGKSRSDDSRRVRYENRKADLQLKLKSS